MRRVSFHTQEREDVNANTEEAQRLIDAAAKIFSRSREPPALYNSMLLLTWLSGARVAGTSLSVPPDQRACWGLVGGCPVAYSQLFMLLHGGALEPL